MDFRQICAPIYRRRVKAERGFVVSVQLVPKLHEAVGEVGGIAFHIHAVEIHIFRNPLQLLSLLLHFCVSFGCRAAHWQHPERAFGDVEGALGS